MKKIDEVLAKTGANREPTDKTLAPNWLNMYVVVDTKAETIIGPIVHDRSPVPITRQITDAVNKPGTMIATNPEDFAIFQVGLVDEKTGQVVGFETPELLTQAIVLKRSET